MKFQRILILFTLLIFQNSFGQSIFTSILNTAGESKKLSQTNPRFPNYTFEWSVGESSIITQNSTTNFQVDHGVLQGYLQIEPQVPENGIWYPDEVKIYPNPVVSNFNVELLTAAKGIVVFHFFDNKGNLIFQRSINYRGIGHTENFTTGELPAGFYVLRIGLKGFPENGGYLQKQGSIKIIKVK